MKIVKHLLILFVAATFAQACSDWLDVTSSAQIRSEEQFSTEGGFKDALIGVYIGMTDPALYSKDMTWNMVDILSQQYAALPGLALYTDIQQFDYESSASAPKIEAVWSKGYNVIANINNILAHMEKNKEVLDPISYSIIKGELLGLRAFVHFDLMRLFGYGNLAARDAGGRMAIPYVTRYSKEIPLRKTLGETLALLEKDIQQALELLKEDPVYVNPERPADYYDGVNQDGFYDNRKRRMNYYAVKALQARVLAWQGGAEKMDLARQAAEAVIAHSPAVLIDSGTYPVSSDPILFSETLFGLYVDGFETVVNHFLDAENQTNYDAVFLTDATVEEIYETANSNIGPPDIRYNTLLESQSQGFVSVKLYQSDNLMHPDIIPLIKLPEMYYIAAEYHIEYGDKGQAITYLNTVRSSRGIIETIPETATVDEVRNELFKEYRKEYVSEGQLFFYYKRIGLETIPGLSESTVAGDDIYMLPYPDSELEFRN